MCGLFGVTSTYLTKDEIHRAVQLGHLNIFRGMDSTGVCVAYNAPPTFKRHKFVFDGHKELFDAVGFFGQDKAKKLFNNDLQKLAVVGHTRFATTGEHDLTCAHPHHFKHIIGCHNGTISKFTVTDDHKRLKSDSRVLFSMLAEKGLEPTLKEVGLVGAYALSWIDKKEGTLNFIRNIDRPLWFVSNGAGDTIYWSSEKRQLEFMMDGSQFFRDPWILPTHTLYRIPLGKPKEAETIKFEPIVERFQGHNFSRGLPNMYDASQWEKDIESYTGAKGHSAGPFPTYRGDGDGSTKKLPEPTTTNTQLPWDDQYTYRTYGGNFVSIAEARAFLESGCVYCQIPLDLSDDAYWIGRDEFLCEKCSHDEFGKAYLTMNGSEKGAVIPLLGSSGK